MGFSRVSFKRLQALLQQPRFAKFSFIAPLTEADALELLIKPFPASDDKDDRYLKALLDTALMQDLYDHLVPPGSRPTAIKKNKKLWFWRILVLAGSLVAICEGVEGVVSILELFSVVPAALVFLASLIFSALAMMVFYSFDLKEISENLNISFKNSLKLLDVYLEQAKCISEFSKALEDKILESNDGEYNRALLQMLQRRHELLKKIEEDYNHQLEKRKYIVFKSVISVFAGALFFASGFFSGETLALKIASTLVGPIGPLAWPIVLAGAVVGIAAFSIYWFVQRPQFENSMGALFGLDKEKIAALSENGENLSKLQKHMGSLSERDKKSQHAGSSLDLELASEGTQDLRVGEVPNPFSFSSSTTSAFFKRHQTTTLSTPAHRTQSSPVVFVGH